MTILGTSLPTIVDAGDEAGPVSRGERVERFGGGSGCVVETRDPRSRKLACPASVEASVNMHPVELPKKKKEKKRGYTYKSLRFT
jgi:hypothetical protein